MVERARSQGEAGEFARAVRGAWLPGAVLLLGVAASFLAFSAERRNEKLQVGARFLEAATTRASAVRRAFEHGGDTAESIVAFFEASENVTREEFSRFARPLLEGHPALQGVSWAPVVPASERAAVERRARESLPGFSFTVRAAQGRMVPAPETEEYVPVLYLEPLAGNEAALGFNVVSDPRRKPAFDAARTTGTIAATGRIRLVQEKEDQHGLLLIAPAFRSEAAVGAAQARRTSIQGFATTVLRSGDLIAGAVAMLEPAGIDLAVLDESADEGEEVLHVAWASPGDPGSRPAEAAWTAPSDGAEHRMTFFFAGRSWTVVIRPAPGAYAVDISRARAILAAGLVISVAIATLFWLLRRRAYELAQSNRALSAEVEERKAAEERLRLFQSLIHGSAEAIYFVDAETGRFQYANERAIRESGYSLAELSARTVGEVVADSPLGESREAWTEWVASLESQPAAVIEGTQRRKDGETFPVELSASLATVSDRRFVVGIAEDISERKRAELQESELRERLLALSFLDGLTGIANRRRFDEYLATEWRRAARQGTALGLILIDLDHFKLYNDRYGHLLGDECLRKVAGVLESAISRPADLVARFGGEEMAMLLPDTSREGASRMAEKIRLEIERLELPHEDSPVLPVVTISAGVGWSEPQPGDSLDKFLEAVDAALYRAKRGGRNRSVVA